MYLSIPSFSWYICLNPFVFSSADAFSHLIPPVQYITIFFCLCFSSCFGIVEKFLKDFICGVIAFLNFPILLS